MCSIVNISTERGGPPALFMVGATVMEMGSATQTFLYLFPHWRWTWYFHCWGKSEFSHSILCITQETRVKEGIFFFFILSLADSQLPSAKCAASLFQ
jgi:hypothetical protein